MRKDIFSIVFLIAFAFISSTALAAGVPSFNSNKYCKDFADTGGNSSYSLEKTCRDMEAEAKADLGRLDVPDGIMSFCTEFATTDGDVGSYSLLKTCIEMELEAKQSLE